MSCKLICPIAFGSLIKILTGCRELNQIAKFSSTELGFLIESMDSFNQTQLSCTIKAKTNNQILDCQTFINLETIPPFISLLRERKKPIVIEFQSNSDICIKDPNILNFDLCTPLKYLCDYEKKYLCSNQESFLISLLVSDITMMLLNLSIGNGIANIKLDSKGQLILKNNFEVGSIHFQKQLKKTNINSYGIVDINVTIKFVKVLVIVAMSKKCTLELPKNPNGNLKIHFTICAEASGYFALIPF